MFDVFWRWMMKWFLKCMKQYADFSGRASRAEYWWFYGSFVAFYVVALLGFGAINENLGKVAAMVIQLALLIPMLSVGVRRMHDIGKSGWFILVPFYSLYLACLTGDAGRNAYGDDPSQILVR